MKEYSNREKNNDMLNEKKKYKKENSYIKRKIKVMKSGPKKDGQ